MQKSYLIRPILYLLSCILYPVFIAIYLVLSIIKTVINIHLKIKHGSSYHGMLSGGDIIWSVEDVSKTVINIFLVLQDDNDNDAGFIERIKKEIYEKYHKNIKDFSKLSCIRQRKLGYTYLLKNQIRISECVKVENGGSGKPKLSRIEVENIISNHSNKPLPRNNDALWEIIIFDKPMESDGQKKHYPILCRFSHMVGDGLSLITVLTTIFGKNSSSVLDQLRQKWAPMIRDRKDEIKVTKLRNFLYFLHVLLMSPFIIIHQSFMRKVDDNILHGQQLCGKKILVYSNEEDQRLVQVVKNMKRVLPTVNFSEFVLTAISASFNAYFEKVGIKQHVSIISSFVFPSTSEYHVMFEQNFHFCSSRHSFCLND